MAPQRGSLDCSGDEGVGDASVVGYLQAKAADQYGTSLSKTGALKSTKLEGARDLKSPDSRHGDAGFQSCLAPESPHSSPLPACGTVMYIRCHWRSVELCDLVSDLTGD